MEKHMTIHPMGRLGNLFFQVIGGWAIAKEYGYKFVLDTSFSNCQYYHRYFRNIPLINASGMNWKQVNIDCYNHYKLTETELKFDNILIHSFLQNSNYFNKYRNEILKEFLNFDTSLSQPNNHFFIHIRLTDFLTSYLHTLNLDNYYTKAIEYLKTQIDFSTTKFFIISDDIGSAMQKEYLKSIPKENIVLIGSNQYNEEQTFKIFTECTKGGIIPHSTYSWWGAYFNPSQEKIIICPNKFIIESHDFSGLYLDYKIIDV
jgi:hypothetical protein